MFRRALRALLLAPVFGFFPTADAQLATATPDPVRVTVSMNADGTQTTYEFDLPHRRATATTIGKDGKMVGRIRYTLDDASRFATGEVYGPDDKLRFMTLHRYDAAGKLTQETQLAPDDSVRNKIVYVYDKNGKQTGYSVYDAAGKLGRQKPGVAPR